MKNLTIGIKHFFRDEEGASAVEYGILVALIAVAIVVTVAAVGSQLNTVFERVKNCLTNTASGCA